MRRASFYINKCLHSEEKMVYLYWATTNICFLVVDDVKELLCEVLHETKDRKICERYFFL